MKYQKIIQYTNKNIRLISRHVQIPINSMTKEIINDMITWVVDSNNVKLAQKFNLHSALGIAAIQINQPLRMFYAYCLEENLNVFCINPKIIAKSDTFISIKTGEGCLSVWNGNHAIVQRYEWIKLQYYCYFNKKVITKTFKNIPTIIIQHELDHLDGILYIDKSIPMDSADKLEWVNKKNSKDEKEK